MPNKRTFLPFGEWLPDQKSFLNAGLSRVDGLVPIYENYYVAPQPNVISLAIPQFVYGLGSIPTGALTWTSYAGTTSKIYEISSVGVITDRSGAAYATPDAVSGSQFSTYGQNVIETRYTAPPNILLAGAGAFTPLHSGTFAPAGRFAFSVRGNLFMANCSVPAPYDAVPAGANPQLVAWSQSDAPRFFGGPRVDPQYVGSDYQQINNDYGQVTGAVGGNYGLVFQQRAIVRVDGPPYTFQEVSRGKGCRSPNSIVQQDQDTYFWGESGPSLLEYGGQLLKSDQVTVLGSRKIARSIIDNVTTFSEISVAPGFNPIEISGASDAANRLIFWAYPGGAGIGDFVVVYNIDEKRFSFFRLNAPLDTAAGCRFLTNRIDTGDAWSTGHNQIFIRRVAGVDQLCYWSVSGGFNWDAVIEGGNVQLDPDMTTRVLRARPILKWDNGVFPVTLSMTLKDVNRPFDTPLVATSSVQDTMGWFVFPDSKYTDFHSLGVTAAKGSNTYAVLEWKGFEVEYVTGPVYSG